MRLVLLFATTMFASATLLFVVQPMIAKLLLPALGGSPAVWTTSMLFFQGTLLLGYGYAHAGARWLSPRKQVIAHIVVVLIALASLPLAIPALDIDSSTAPTLWVLTALALSVGPSFFALSTTAPLLQHWFAHTGHPDGEDPYFLYAASNIGSMVALLGYPFVIEPTLGVSAQTSLWSWLYLAFVALLIACATQVFHVRASHAAHHREATSGTWRERVRWVLLAAAPSSLMLGLTQYITIDVAPVPLLWVIPLALYLLTFILVFAKRAVLLPDAIRTAIPVVVAMIFLPEDLRVEVLAHLGCFFLLTLFCHGQLARERPSVARLTEFFFLVSLGGVLGGLFNAVIAPALFDRTLEYHLVLCLLVACIYPAQFRVGEVGQARHLTLLSAVAIAVVYLHIQYFWWVHDPDSVIAVVIVVSVYGVLSLARPRWENVAFALLLALGAYSRMETDHIIAYDRSFFAAYKIYDEYNSDGDRFRVLSHGTTGHGAQPLDSVAATMAVSYYHAEGPVGQVIDTIEHRNILVIGLGAGAVAAYGHERAKIDFFEIDPLVEEIANTYFTYLKMCGEDCTVTIGDGRRLLEQSTKTWDIIILDAYNSDAVPTHLLTLEALDLYLEHLSPEGVLLFHVSNRYLDLEGVVGRLATERGLDVLAQSHTPSEELHEQNVSASHYVVVGRTQEILDPLFDQDYWYGASITGPLWTDDFTNVVDVIMW